MLASTPAWSPSVELSGSVGRVTAIPRCRRIPGGSSTLKLTHFSFALIPAGFAHTSAGTMVVHEHNSHPHDWSYRSGRPPGPLSIAGQGTRGPGAGPQPADR